MNPAPPDGPAPALSDAGVAHLARARFWARLTGVMIIGYGALMSLTTVVATLSLSSGARRDYALGRALGSVLVLLIPTLPAVLVLVYAANLSRFARGQPGALASAARNLRGLWVIATLAYAALLLVTVRSMRP